MATDDSNSTTMGTPPPPPTANGNGNDSHTSTLTLRMIMQGKEAGSIIGKKGDNVKKFREESGAKINISDASCPERIVTVTGTTDQIYKAFTMICKKFEEDIQTLHQNSSLPKPPVTIRLIVPASQCGSLIGKGGSKIKEIREVTGASIQVASEMLPNSTERAVTISGSADSITQCIYHICCVMIESPPKGATIPYRPKPAMPPVILAGGQAFTLQGQYPVPPQHGHPDMIMDGRDPSSQHQRYIHDNQPRANMIAHYPAMPQMPKMGAVQQQGLLGQPMPMIPGAQQHLIHAGVPGIVMQGFPRPQNQQNPHSPNNPGAQAHEMTIPNDLIGCIIGRGGSKINEIRQLSGAQIKIANVEEGSSDRKVTITGMPDTINAAQYLINASIEIHKQQLALDPNAAAAAAAAAAAGVATHPTSTALSMASSTNPHHPAHHHLAIPVSQMIKPMPLVAGLTANSAVGAAIFSPTQNVLTTKMKGGTPILQAAIKKNGNKFAPY